MKNSICISCIIILMSFFPCTHLSAINSGKVTEGEKFEKLTGKKARKFIKKNKLRLDSLLKNNSTDSGTTNERSAGDKAGRFLLAVSGIVVLVIIVVYLVLLAFINSLSSLF